MALATNEQIEVRYALDLKYGYKVTFRHFLMEASDRRTESGVRHIQMGRSKLFLIDGKYHVKHHGKFEAVRANFMVIDGRNYVLDLRIDSDYLGDRY